MTGSDPATAGHPGAGRPGDPYLPDLAARRLGGMAVVANDEFFAPKENLLLPTAPVFEEDRYSDRGKEMDGWETRRRRVPGNDWCIVRLGVPGVVRRALVDTSHFRGNFPRAASLEGCWLGTRASAETLTAPSVRWMPLLAETPLRGDARNEFALDADVLVSHVRLWIHPDGGVARLRLYGEAVPDLRAIAGGNGAVDLAAVVNGGRIVDCSDRFFSSPESLIAVGDSRDMHDGWETRRRRGPGHDWVIVRLAAPGDVSRVEVDTTNFKGNHPESISVEACDAPPGGDLSQARWREIVGRVPLAPHARHPLPAAGEAVSHVRLNVFPDGGVARLRVHGRPTDAGWRRWGVRRLDVLPAPEAEHELRACCGSRAWAAAMVGRRPFADFGTLVHAADDVWAGLDPGDRREAFAAHPRIGEGGRGPWSRQEQAGAAGAGAETLAALAEGNRAYEDRFGHVFLICAAGRSADELLAALRERLDNDPATELAVAAEEQRKITRLRLDKLMRPGGVVR